jgi:predicted Rossmann fold nucleotide-binding protein DprA/Smf involved in DNA uptake
MAGHARVKSKKGLRAGQRWAAAYHRKIMAVPGPAGDKAGTARKRLGA